MKMKLRIPSFVTPRFEVPVRTRPVKVCIVFDAGWQIENAESAGDTPAMGCEIHAYDFAKLKSPEHRMKAVRHASAADVLIVAVQTDRPLPLHVQFSLGISLGLRDKGHRGVLALLTRRDASRTRTDSSLQHYLKTIAPSGGWKFVFAQFGAVKSIVRAPASPFANRNRFAHPIQD
jgi:hypothetical protein